MFSIKNELIKLSLLKWTASNFELALKLLLNLSIISGFIFLNKGATIDNPKIDLFLLNTFVKVVILSLVIYLFSKLTNNKDLVEVNWKINFYLF